MVLGAACLPDKVDIVIRQLHDLPLLMAREPETYAIKLATRWCFWLGKTKTHTFLNSDGPYAAHVVINTDQLRSLDHPELLLVCRGQAAKELQPECEQLTFIRIVKQAGALAAVRLRWIVNGQRLVADIGHCTNSTISLVEDLQDTLVRLGGLQEIINALPWQQSAWCSPSKSASDWQAPDAQAWRCFRALE